MNVYYDPQSFGLETVGTIEFAEPNYSFDFGVVWFHRESGKFYFAADSGCSCPTPFDDYHNVESLGEPMSYSELTSYLRTLKAYDWSPPEVPVPIQVARVIELAQSFV